MNDTRIKSLRRALILEYWHYNSEGRAYPIEAHRDFLHLFYKAAGFLPGIESEEELKNAAVALKEKEQILLSQKNDCRIVFPLWSAYMPVMEGDFETPEDSFERPDFCPYITPYLIDDEKVRPAILVFAGGRRMNLGEGDPYCRFFNSIGYHAILVSHRADRRYMTYVFDVQRALRLTRHYASEWRIDASRLAAIGSSKGGIAISGYIEDMRFEENPSAYDPKYQPDDVDRLDGSLQAFIGVYTSDYKNSPMIKKEGLDCNHPVYDQYPPTCLILGGADYGRKIQADYVHELIQHDVRLEVHLFDGMVHGVGLADGQFVPNGGTEQIPAAQMWPSLVQQWLQRVMKQV